MFRKIVCFVVAVSMMTLGFFNDLKIVSAEDDEFKTIDDLISNCGCENIAVYEANTKTLLGGKGSDKKKYISHLTKLMTALLVYDNIENGNISYDTKLITSEHANSMTGIQIWLDVGEEITVDELIKAITISNANDAAVVLAEGCCGSEKSFVGKMNQRARELGMSSTHFDDCTGISHKNVSTAADMAVLTGELAKNSVFEEYYKMRIANVGRKGSQLVTQNKLVNNYKGCCGYKSCYDEEVGEMLSAASKQRDMAICVVLIGGNDNDVIFDEAKAVMTYAFTHNEVYYPEIPSEALAEIPVEHGQKPFAKAEIADSKDIIIKRGSYRRIYTELDRKELLQAPVNKGDKIGILIFKNDKGEILRCTVTAAEDVKKTDFFFAFKCLLLNLFNI